MGFNKDRSLITDFGSDNSVGNFCMKFLGFMYEDESKGVDPQTWETMMTVIREKQPCPYRDRCPIYAKTKKKSFQLKLFQ